MRFCAVRIRVTVNSRNIYFVNIKILEFKIIFFCKIFGSFVNKLI